MRLTINSIVKGVVIDHIRAGQGINIFNHLGLNKADFTVALIVNATSKKLGRKDIIKIENEIDLDFTVLGLLDPNVTVNIITDEKISKKIKVKLPEKVEGALICKNPRCVTSIEKNITHVFILVDEKQGLYRCQYCDEVYSVDDM